MEKSWRFRMIYKLISQKDLLNGEGMYMNTSNTFPDGISFHVKNSVADINYKLEKKIK